MSSFQSWLQRLRDRQFNAAQLRQEIQAGDWLNRSLAVGLVLGLLLGLWIGWGLWPVQWENASLGELREDAKADYLAAVSDAYVIYSSPEAAAVAQQRLSAFGSPDLAKDFNAAIAYYSNSNAADKTVRVSNLSRLASALGLTGPVVTTNSQATPLNVLIQPQATVNPAGVNAGAGITNSGQTNAASNANAANGSWLNGILGLLIALMVIAAIFYLYLSIRPAPSRRPPLTSDEPLDHDTINAEFDKMNDASVTRRTQMYGAPDPQKTSYPSPASGVRPGGTWTSGSWTSAAAPAPARRTERDEYEFEDESDDEATAPRYTTAQRYQPDQPTRRPSAWSDQSTRNLEEYPAEDDDDWDDEEETGEEADANETAEPHTPSSASQRSAANLTISDAPSLRREPPVEPSPALSATPAAAARSGLAGRASRLKLLEKYTAQYQAGIANYDEAHQILDPSTNKYIGEIGMGVSTKNALLQNDPDQVIALEVWLFDKADERNIGNQTRILLSEYAIDHNLEQAFLKERQDDPRPFTAQPGVRFQLEGHSLRLDCEIIEATYTKSGSSKGIFQNLKVEMTVLQKA
ncbi:MAG: hypothetical protein U0350_37115 [Caldilineaceae bacterium]